MRVSQYYKLGRTQPSLEFIDVDISADTRAYVDPRALRSIKSDWGTECVALLQSFFTEVLDATRRRDRARALELLSSLREPNETHLGLSTGPTARGRGMGVDIAEEVYESLRHSRAVSSGLIADLEDTALFVPGIGHDRVSDITVNIIREPLIRFTQDACAFYGIPLLRGIVSGQLWDMRTRGWRQASVDLPRTKYGRLLLVPKSIVRRKPEFDATDYYEDYIIPFLAEEELKAGSSLVQVLKSGKPRVTKKSVKQKHAQAPRKVLNLETTLREETLLDRYRSDRSRERLPPGHEQVASLTTTLPPDWDALLKAVKDVPTGTSSADDYHRAVEALLNALLYPALDFPVREFKIHEGRKRIDIMYTNRDTRGFFHWVVETHGAPATLVPVECKNYGSEVANPEFDQLAGRFSRGRGMVGLLLHRGFGRKQRWVARCRDTAADGRGFILPLDDGDLAELVQHRKDNADSVAFPLLFERFREVIS